MELHQAIHILKNSDPVIREAAFRFMENRVKAAVVQFYLLGYRQAQEGKELKSEDHKYLFSLIDDEGDGFIGTL